MWHKSIKLRSLLNSFNSHSGVLKKPMAGQGQVNKLAGFHRLPEEPVMDHLPRVWTAAGLEDDGGIPVTDAEFERNAFNS